MEEEARRQEVNPACPNAANPFHRCAQYCPVPAPPAAAVVVKPPPPPQQQNGTATAAAQNGTAAVVQNGTGTAAVAQNVGSTHSDGELQQEQPKPRRRDRAGGSGGLPFYVFLHEGADGDGKKVDPRCPNAGNPFHVCTEHCQAKIAEVSRSSEGGKSPMSLFSRHSRRSSSSSEDGSVKSGGSKKVDPKCPNAGNPFHECTQHCAAKMKDVNQQKRTEKKSSSFRKKGSKEIAVVQNWKVDPRCPNAGNPFHICAQYCFDHLNETGQKDTNKPDSRKGKAVLRAEQTGEINSDCPNASNPYHKCGEYCRRKGDR